MRLRIRQRIALVCTAVIFALMLWHFISEDSSNIHGISHDIGDFYPGEKSYGEQGSYRYPTKRKKKKVDTIVRAALTESPNRSVLVIGAGFVHDATKGATNMTVAKRNINITVKSDTNMTATEGDNPLQPASVEKRQNAVFLGGMLLRKSYLEPVKDLHARAVEEKSPPDNNGDNYKKRKAIMLKDTNRVNIDNISNRSTNIKLKASVKKMLTNDMILNDTKVNDRNTRFGGIEKHGRMPRVKLRDEITNKNHSRRIVSHEKPRRTWNKKSTALLYKNDSVLALQNQLDPWPDETEHFGKALQYPTKMPSVRIEVKPESGIVGLGHGMSPLAGVNVISMSLYGSTRRYTIGAMRNADLARQNFPGWRLRIYTEAPGAQPRYGLVPTEVIEALRQRSVEIFFVNTHEERVPPMGWRFLVADDMEVDRFIIRDVDSRLTERDAAAVRMWIESGKPFNCIRDHPSHAGYAISGGLWGGRPAALRGVIRRSWRELMAHMRGNYLDDMHFLNHVIWPLVAPVAYCSDSVSCDVWENSHPFPVPRFGYETVGQVTDERERGRQVDLQILRRVGENPKCSPTLTKHMFLKKT